MPDTTERQRLAQATHLLPDGFAPVVGAYHYETSDERPAYVIASVEVIGGLTLQASDPAVFRKLADACIAAEELILGSPHCEVHPQVASTGGTIGPEGVTHLCAECLADERFTA